MIEIIKSIEAIQSVLSNYMDLFTQQANVNEANAAGVEEANNRLKALEKASQ